jgi:hypothetical protein
VSKPVLTVILAHGDLAAQQAHLARGALFLPEPEPLPEQYLEIVLRIETAVGTDVELDARVLQVLPGHGIAVAPEVLAVAKTALAPLFAEPPGEDDVATFIFWGRAERPASARPRVPSGAPLAVQASIPIPASIPTATPSAIPTATATPIPTATPTPIPTAAPTPDAIASGTSASTPTPIPTGDPPPSTPDDVPFGDLDLDETAKLEAEIAGMNTNQKMQLAMRGSRLARTLLLKDVNKNLQAFIIQNPRITLDEVKSLAGNRQLNPDVLSTIANHKDWGNNPNIVVALVRNPKTPQLATTKLIEKVPMVEARRLAKANDVPRHVVSAARKRLTETEK